MIGSSGSTAFTSCPHPTRLSGTLFLRTGCTGPSGGGSVMACLRAKGEYLAALSLQQAASYSITSSASASRRFCTLSLRALAVPPHHRFVPNYGTVEPDE